MLPEVSQVLVGRLGYLAHGVSTHHCSLRPWLEISLFWRVRGAAREQVWASTLLSVRKLCLILWILGWWVDILRWVLSVSKRFELPFRKLSVLIKHRRILQPLLDNFDVLTAHWLQVLFVESSDRPWHFRGPALFLIHGHRGSHFRALDMQLMLRLVTKKVLDYVSRVNFNLIAWALWKDRFV